MITTIDNKVVEMQFKAENFGENVKSTIKMIDLLKNSLNFGNATKGLDDVESGFSKIGKTARGISFGAISDGLDTITSKFKIADIIQFTFFQNLTKSAMDTGKKLVKSLSIDQITSGWSKYENMTTSVQTIMSATEKTWQSYAESIGYSGTQMEYVSSELAKLNWFSDETSYSLTDMTDNIGKFTSNGIALNDAVVAMEGIAVWAAKSGQNSSNAARAMYNLSQAMSAGAVQVKDWMSIENANMATAEFKQTVLEAAADLGVLKKSSDGVFKLDGDEINIENFRETLKDKWFNTEVLMKTLDTYGKSATYLSDISDKYGVTATGFLGVLKDYNAGVITLEDASEELGIKASALEPIFNTLNSEEYALSLSAFKAAQETKTLKESLEATKDAVSTGWMKSFEFIFGNYEEAKAFWSEFTERLWDIFAASGEVRNRILSIWKDEGGRDRFVESLWNIWDALDNIKSIGVNALENVFGKKTIDYYVYYLTLITKKFQNFSKSILEFSNDGDGKIFNTFLKIFNMIKKIGSVFAGFVAGFKKGFSGFGEEFKILFETISKAFNKFLISKDVYTFLSNTKDVFYELGFAFGSFIKTFLHDLNTFLSSENKLIGFGKFIMNFFSNIWKVISTFLKNSFNVEINPPRFITTLTDYFKEKIPMLADAIFNFKAAITGFENPFSKLTGSFENNALDNAADSFVSMSKASESLGKSIKKNGVVGGLKNISSAFKDGEFKIDKNSIFGFITSGAIATIAIQIASLFKNLNNVPKSVNKIINKSGGLIDTLRKFVDNIPKTMQNALKPVTKVFDGLNKSLSAFQRDLNADILMKIAIAVGILAASIFALSMLKPEKVALGVGAVSALMGVLYKVTQRFLELNFTKINPATIALLGQMLQKMAVAILILAVAVRVIAGIDEYTKILAATVAIGALLYVLTEMAKGLVRCAAIASEAGNMKTLGVLLLMSSMIKSLAKSVLILSAAVWILAKLDPWEMMRATGAVILMVVTLAEAMKSLSSVTGIAIVGNAFAKIAGSILILAIIMKVIGGMDPTEFEQGVIALAGMLGGICLALYKLSRIDSKTIVETSFALLIVSMALKNLGKALLSLDGVGYEGMVSLVTVLLALAIALPRMNATISGSFALMVLAVALNLLVPAIKKTQELDIMKVVEGMVSLAVAVLALGGISYLISALAPALVAAGTGFLVFGVGIIACTAGIWLLAKSLLVLSSIGKSDSKSISKLMKSLISSVVSFCKEVGEGIVVILETIAENTPRIVDAVVSIFSSIIDGWARMIPKLVNFAILVITALRVVIPLLTSLFVTILDSLEILVPRIIHLGFTFVMSFLQGIRDNIGEITKIAADILITFINAMAEKIPEVMQAGVDFIFSMIKAMGEGIRDNSTKFYEVSKEFVKNVIEGINNVIMLMAGDVKDIGVKVLDKIKEGINPIKNGVNKFKEIGKNVIKGFINGIESMVEDLYKKMVDVGKTVIDKFKKVLGIASPSKVFKAFGEYTDEGFIEGIESKSGKVIGSVSELGNDVKEGMGDALSSLSSIDFDNLESPTIRPVMDLSNIQNGFGAIDNMLYAQRSMNLAGSVSIERVDPMAETTKLREAFEVSNSKFANDIIAAINNNSTDTNVNVTLAGDAGGVFRLVRSENDKFVKSTNYNPLSRSRV